MFLVILHFKVTSETIVCPDETCTSHVEFHLDGCNIMNRTGDCFCQNTCPSHFDVTQKECEVWQCKPNPTPQPTPDPTPSPSPKPAGQNYFKHVVIGLAGNAVFYLF